MFFFPKKFKYKKQHRNYKKCDIFTVPFSSKMHFGVQALKAFALHATQLVVLQKIVNKCIRKKYKGSLITLVSVNLPLTKKASGVRMGKGKGSIFSWCFLVTKGRILFKVQKSNIPLFVFLRACMAVKYRSGGRLASVT